MITINVNLTVSGVVTFPPGTRNSGTITGAVVFTGDSSNNSTGVINGAAVFSGTTENNGTVNGNAQFNDAAFNWAVVVGAATFSGHTKNLNNVVGNATFNGSSRNESGGHVFGAAVFNDNTKNMGQISGNAVFNGLSLNGDPEGGEGGVVNGDAAINDCARDFGEITGTVTVACNRRVCEWYGRFDPPLKGIWETIGSGGERRLRIIGLRNREALVERYGNSLTRSGGSWQKCPPEGCFAYPETYCADYDFVPDYDAEPEYLNHPGNPWNVDGDPNKIENLSASTSEISGQGDVVMLNWSPVLFWQGVQSYFTERSKDDGEWIGLEYWPPIIAHYTPTIHTVPAATDGPGTYIYRVSVVRNGITYPPSEPSNPVTI